MLQHTDILDNCIEQFGERLFLFQHDCAPVQKERSVKISFDESGAEELQWPAPNDILIILNAHGFGMSNMLV